MNRYVKSAMLVATGLLWLLFALGMVIVLCQFLEEGAGVGCFNVSPFTVLVGLAPMLGLMLAAGLCLVIGMGLCSFGLVPAPEPEPRLESMSKPHPATALRFGAVTPDPPLRCVQCEIGLSAPVHICPECGWTQPGNRDNSRADS